ncbi:threonine ammonia-lyase [Clostridium sp. KNHs216]|uniref:threonine ammonia-lyase n=1 Tax=Clostridium sp. KNHs216 TaxID=1550235 RepID=UPI0011511EE2|nr:threonine ammonia-lyase [Clostridium sp. KNHs216]TQI68107.1 threonine dehydratase [Clostridium sp. KNHs216]
MFTMDKIYHAEAVLKDVVHRTELIYAPHINHESEVYLKPENLQRTGSFKVRGAYYKISQLSEAERAKGVIACSAGNHAQGVAFAAEKRGIPSLICIPEGAPISKIEATKSYGAKVCLVKGVYDDAFQKACELQKESGAVLIHPFNDPDVIAGQGTIGLEILNELPDADAVIVPVGGGGLISGIAFAVKTLKPDCKVYGVQASGAPGMLKSVENRKLEPLAGVSTFADGIAVKCPGDLTYEFCRKYVDKIVTVTDDETAMAVLALIEQHKLIAEGAGAVSVAAAMFNKIDIKGKKTVCLLSGGNIDVTILSRVISRGLQKAGRLGELVLKTADRPGQIKEVTAIIADLGANVVSIHHDRSREDISVDACTLSIRMETKDSGHLAEIRQAITKAGYLLIH